MFPTVSSLSHLFSSAAASLAVHSPKTHRQYDSAKEEFVTHDLLYPQGETLHQDQHHAYPFQNCDPVSAMAKSSDDKGGLSIQATRDVRIIIAQKAHEISCVLYDSHPPPPFTTIRSSPSNDKETDRHPKEESLAGAAPRRNGSLQKSHTAPHSRHSSISQTAQSMFTSPVSPPHSVSEFGGLFSGSRFRGSNPRPPTSDGESAQSKIAREEREETDALLGCMFGATGLISVSSTKLHIKPFIPSVSGASRPPSTGTSRPESPRVLKKRRTPLTRSTTAENLQSLKSSPPLDDSDQQASRRKSSSIVITKLFSVDPRDLDFTQATSDETGVRPKDRGPSSDGSDKFANATHIKSGDKAKQVKIPIFAVAMVLYIPPQQRVSTPSVMQLSTAAGRSTFFENSWSPGYSPHPDGLKSDTDSCVDYAISQWAILIRALSSMEHVTRCKLGDLLTHLYVPAAAPARKTLQLATGALQQFPIIHKAVEKNSKRVAAALHLRRVSTGQNRWGVWRGVARGVGKWAGSREQNFFLLNILTAFLGNHTDWLDVVRPRRHRRFHPKQERGAQEETITIKQRTVVVSLDKMAARRIVFLLSVFLPSNCTDPYQDYPSDSSPITTNLAYSASPPRGMPQSRRQSLRRTMNRHTISQHASQNQKPDARTVAFSSSMIGNPDEQEIDQDEGFGQQSRRPSDARSMHSIVLPISSSATRKSSTTTTATVMPDPPFAVPRFSPFATDSLLSTSAEARPESSGSLAALSLQRTLSRSGSNEHSNASTDSQTPGRWGSTRGGFWSRRGSSTENSDLLASSEEGLGILGVPKDLHTRNTIRKLAQAVEDIDLPSKGKRPARIDVNKPPSPADTKNFFPERPPSAGTSPQKRVPHTPAPGPFPLRLSVDEKDGVVDVELPPMASYSGSFASTMSSSRPTRTASSSFNDHSSFCSPRSGPVSGSRRGSDSTLNVAGWLRNYHPDFALQGVRPYDALKEDIKQSMRDEPAPLTTATNDRIPPADDWTDVCTTLIADTTNFTVTRLTLRRKDGSFARQQGNTTHDRGDSYEDFFEEPMMDMDPVLTDAVERIISHSGHSSRVPSRAPSPPRSEPAETGPALEIPRSECKKIILGALVQVLKSVSAEMSDQPGNGEGNSGEPKRKDNVTQDNALREGVRKWLKERDH